MTSRDLFVPISLVSSLLVADPVWCQETVARVWKMKDGKTMTAMGVSVNFGGICAESPDGKKKVFVPFKQLDPSEISYAVNKLPVIMGNSETFKLVGQTISSARYNYQVVTGYAVSFPTTTSGSTSSGNGSTSTSGGIREITKREGKSSKLVELKMSSLCDGTGIWVDFMVVTGGGGGKRAEKWESGVYYFKETGDVSLFDFSNVNDYVGWAFVFRSLESGKILGSSASIEPLRAFAESTVTEKRSSSKMKAEEIRKLISNALSKG